MRWGRLGLWVVPVIAASIVATACGDDPPTREIQQAQSALDSARSAGAADYARDEFTAAEKALQSARDAVEQRDYRLALTNAIDSRERAQTAAKEAADQKAVARTRTERMLNDTAAALAEAHDRLKAAENQRSPLRTLATARSAIEQSDHHVQEARTAVAQGDYVGALNTLQAANSSLADATRELDAVLAASPRRRR